MAKTIALVLSFYLLGSVFSFAAEAFPAASLKQPTTSDVTLVRSFCGMGFHRGVHGYCIRNGSSVVYARPMHPSAEVVTRLACPDNGFQLFPYAGCFAPACPEGYYLGPYGQCFPYWHGNL
jgi:hypothetical protein